jgi:hypothetical protein
MLGFPNSPDALGPVTRIDTLSGENLIVAPKGHGVVTISVRCPRFGRISHVRLDQDQVAALAGALTGIVLELRTTRPPS